MLYSLIERWNTYIKQLEDREMEIKNEFTEEELKSEAGGYGLVWLFDKNHAYYVGGAITGFVNHLIRSKISKLLENQSSPILVPEGFIPLSEVLEKVTGNQVYVPGPEHNCKGDCQERSEEKIKQEIKKAEARIHFSQLCDSIEALGAAIKDLTDLQDELNKLPRRLTP